MANIVREDQATQTALITINLEKSDYQPKVEDELKKLRKKVAMKGFRKGKVPMSYMKKVYGKQILAEEINTLLSDQLNEYIKEHKLDILGQPLPLEEEVPDLDDDDLEALSFKYHLGLAPDFELKGMDEETALSKHKVEVDEDRVNQEIDKITKQYGNHTHPEEIGEADMVNFQATEVEFAPKTEPLDKELSLSMDLIPDEKLRKTFIGKKKGDVIEVENIFALEDKSEEDFRKFVLGLKDDTPVNPKFNLEVSNIHRQEKAELNQEFFDKVLGPDKVKDEKEFREEITSILSQNYDNQAQGKLYSLLQEKLMEQNVLTFPDEFLKKWLKTTNEELDEQKIEDDYSNFTKGLTWSLILGKLADKFGLEVSQEEIVNSFRAGIQQYFQGYADEATMTQFTQRMMSDSNAVNRRAEEILSEKALKEGLEIVKIEEQDIHWKAFDELLKAE